MYLSRHLALVAQLPAACLSAVLLVSCTPSSRQPLSTSAPPAGDASPSALSAEERRTRLLWREARDEAKSNLARMYRATFAYFLEEQLDPTSGEPLPPHFPESTPLTPEDDCCASPDHRCHSSDDAWRGATWRRLDFAPEETHLLRYQFEADSTRFTVRAVGDLDCDGVLTTFEKSATVTEDQFLESEQGRDEVTITNPYE